MPARHPLQRNPNSINWEGLKAEFLTFDGSLSEFRKLNHLSLVNFYNKTKGWKPERELLRKKGVKIVKKKIEESYEKFAEDQIKLFEFINAQAYKINADTIDPSTGKIKTALTAQQLVQISNALSSTLKSFRLIVGKSTENISQKGDQYLSLLDMVQKINEGKEADIIEEINGIDRET